MTCRRCRGKKYVYFKGWRKRCPDCLHINYGTMPAHLMDNPRKRLEDLPDIVKRNRERRNARDLGT